MERLKVLLYLTTFLLTSDSLFGQIPKFIFNEVNGEEFDSNYFTLSKKTFKQNVGVYHFGESEGEWSLVFLPFEDSVIIQVWNGFWGEIPVPGFENQLFWLHKCQTFNNVKIKDGKFYFGIYSGQFVDYKVEKYEQKAVLLFSDPINGRNYKNDSAEVGFYLSSIDTFFDNKERFDLSLEVKPEVYFLNKTKLELKILRNTIYANYGLIFASGSEMDKYFSSKDWYRGWSNDVSSCLTEIEKRNLAILKRFESQ